MPMLPLSPDQETALAREALGPITRGLKWVGRKFKGWRERRSFQNRVRVLLNEVNLYIAGPPAGTLTVRLKLVNFTRRNLTVEQVEVDYWEIASRGMQDRDTPLKASGNALRKEVGDVTFSITLHPADVANIMSGIQPTTDPRSCPDVSLNIRGYLTIRVGSGQRRERRGFEFVRRIPFSVPGGMPAAQVAAPGTDQEQAPDEPSRTRPLNPRDQEHERRVKEYEFTLSMLQDTGQSVWVINGSYLLAETVVLGLLAQGLVSAHDLSGLLAIGAVLGFAISIFWWASFERAYGFYNLRIRSAREFEAELGYHVLSKGKDLSDGKKVRVGDQEIQIPGLARWGGIQDWTERLIWTFSLTFFGVFVFSAWRFTHRTAPILLASESINTASLSAAPLVVTVVEIVSSVVIAAFAVLQWWLSKKAETTRKTERAEDQLAEADAARATVWAEWFRIWTVSQQWSNADLTDPAIVANLDASDILPRDWATATMHLGRLGLVPAYFGSTALAMAHDAGKLARALFLEVESYDRMMPQIEPAASKFKEEHLPNLKKIEADVKETATEAANLLQDALDHTLSAKIRRYPSFNERMLSKTGPKLAAELTAIGAGTAPPQHGNAETGTAPKQ